MMDLIIQHLSFVLQVLTLGAIAIVLVQVKLADELDQIRWSRDTHVSWLIELRRATQIGKVLALIWIVVYSDMMKWQPWPPIVVFIAAFDLYLVTNVIILRKDLKRVREQEIQVRRAARAS